MRVSLQFPKVLLIRSLLSTSVLLTIPEPRTCTGEEKKKKKRTRAAGPIGFLFPFLNPSLNGIVCFS